MLFLKKKQHNSIVIPKHIAIIMDGNGRWAKKRGLPRSAGHKVGAKTFENVCEYCIKYGVQYITVYAFSTENWKRSKEEVTALMNLFRNYLKDAFTDDRMKRMRINFIGDRSMLDDDLRQKMSEVEQISKNTKELIVNFAINYGGRQEIVNACNLAIELSKKGEIDKVDEDILSDLMYTHDVPDPDFIIRPSGEKRISHFLLWQCAYSEFEFMNVLWPDFSPEDLDAAIEEYHRLNRRFGGT